MSWKRIQNKTNKFTLYYSLMLLQHFKNMAVYIKLFCTSNTYRHQIFDHIHVWQRIDFGRFACISVYFVEACQRVASIYVHGTWTADTWRNTQSVEWVTEICRIASLKPVNGSFALMIKSHQTIFYNAECRLCLTLSAGASECERWVNLILDFDEGIQNHGTTANIKTNASIDYYTDYRKKDK